MQGAQASDNTDRQARSVAAQVLRLVLYYDVFSHPLTADEIQRFVGGSSDEVERSLAHLCSVGQLERDGRWVFTPGRGDLVPRRQRRARNAERLWPSAKRSAAVLARFPFIRGVLISGGLSKNAVAEGADVDFFLIIEPGHVWTSKSALQAFRRALPERARECFCTNYLIAGDQLLIDEHNMFTAMELATAVPMYGPEACTALVDQNRAWAAEHIWNQDFIRGRAQAAASLPERSGSRSAERLVQALPGVEERALGFWNRYWNRKYGWLDSDSRDQRFKRREDIATNHLNDFQGWVLREWRERCVDAGIEDE